MASFSHRLAPRLAFSAGVASWLILAVGLSLVAITRRVSPDSAASVLTLALGIFFVVLLVQLAAAASADRSRRTALIVLLVSIALWAAGSAVLNATEVPDLSKFPAPGEWFFLASYLAMVGYLVIDALRHVRTTLAVWLETLVICGGTTCLAGGVLLTPVADHFGRDGLPLLLALLYPLIDIALGTLVVGQVMMRARPTFRDSAGLVIAFALFTFADSSIVTNLGQAYDFSVLDDACYGIGFALIVTRACRRPSRASSPQTRRQGPVLMLLAGLIALTILALNERTTLGPYLIIPSLVTLLAAGGRLTIALRDANRAAEAFALARSDDLTQLPNRRALLAVVDQRLAADLPLTLMLLDLDGFKEVNDTLGHAAGDSVLQQIAAGIHADLPAEVMFGRLGGDEFAVVTPHADPVLNLELARHILSIVREPLTVEGIQLSTDASIGVAPAETIDTSSSELLRRADVAMYQAKVTRASALLYDGHFDHFSREKLRIADELRTAIAQGQLALWYQPQIEANTQRICGLEALIRWNHPREGLLSPASFLPAARRAGLMLALSTEVARIAVADLKRWQAAGLSPRISVNCAPPELLSGLFMPELYAALAAADVAADSLMIEVTEESFISDPERARAILYDIRQHHVQISIDDYGTGFSSLSYLRDLPVQELKIDRSFVSTMLQDERSRVIVSSTLQLAKALGLRTVAEGVENSETAADLIALGVDVLQGYHFSKPIPPWEVATFIPGWTAVGDAAYDKTYDTRRSIS